MRDVLPGKFADESAVAQRNHAVGDSDEFVEAVRDENNAHALRLEILDHPHEATRFRKRQTGRRFIHDHHAGVQGQRLGDFKQLALRDR